MDAISQFRDAIRSAGLIPPDMIELDKLHRFSTNGKRGDVAGWCKLFADGEGGVFGDWRSGEQQTWQAKRDRPFTPAEREAFRQRCEQERKEREAAKARERADAARKATATWKAATAARADHPYLSRKQVSPVATLREIDASAAAAILGYTPKSDGDALAGRLLVAPVKVGGALSTLELIDEAGHKSALYGGAKAGGYWAAQSLPEGAGAGLTLLLGEGVATALSAKEASGHPSIAALSAGNLLAVAKTKRERYPAAVLVLLADLVKATGAPDPRAIEAARSVGGLVAIPDFGADRKNEHKDFNDMAALHGMEAVKQAIASASAPARAEHQPSGDGARARDPAGRITYRRVSDILAKPICWLWQGRFARGKVSMLAGNPALGKSQITASMAAIVSTGGCWPVDRTRCEMGNVVILSAEDDPADTIRPRLEAAGADLSRVFILDAVVEGYRGDGSEIHRAFNLKTDLARLGAMLEEIGGAALIVVDPITAYLGDADSHKNAEIRALLSPLSDLAAKYGAAVVCVSHFNKATGGEALMRVTGSLAFVAAARAAFVVAKDPENEARRLFLPLKNNIGNDQTGLAFSIQSAQIKSAAGLIETSRVMWEAETVTVTADEAMSQQADPEERGETDDAKDFLRGLLADGGVPSKQIRADAEGAGHAWRTIQRAQKALGIEAVKSGMAGGWVWRLAGHPTHEDRQETPKTATQNVWQPSHSSGDVGGLRGNESGAVEVEI